MSCISHHPFIADTNLMCTFDHCIFWCLQLVLTHRLSVCMEYVVEGCRVCPQWLQADLLRALAALLYENVGNVVKVYSFIFYCYLIQLELNPRYPVLVLLFEHTGSNKLLFHSTKVVGQFVFNNA